MYKLVVGVWDEIWGFQPNADVAIFFFYVSTVWEKNLQR